ncbi:MAG TPA: PEGA domain-containing protein [Kofleriaceae bacterium]|nr:PEGA domain-containing protein [Kofleriaceae bacterium]
MRTTFAFGLALAVLIALRSPARADSGVGDIGVVVTGETSMQPQLTAQIGEWLSRHGHALVPSPLPPDAITQLVDCIVISDRKCAREIVEKRALTPRVVLAQLDSKNLGGGARDITVTAYWFDKGHDAVAERKTCERCTVQSLRVTADEILRKLLGSGDGHVKLKSSPPGARIIIDGQPIGVTPLDWDLPQGKHTIAMDKRGFVAASREIAVVTDRTDTLALDLAPVAGPEGRASWKRIVPIAMVVAGGAAVVAGGVMVALDQDTGPNEPLVIRNTGPGGVALMISGAVVGGTGAFLLFRSSGSSAPVATIGSGGAYVGWAGRF